MQNAVIRTTVVMIVCTSVGLAACTPPPTDKVGPVGSSSGPDGTNAIMPAGSPKSQHYQERELFKLDLEPSDIAVDASSIFVAQTFPGARPSDAQARVIASIDGAAPTVVPGSDTPAGVGVLGLGSRAGILYLSLSSGSDQSLTGVFSLVGGRRTPIAGGSSRDLGTGNGDGGTPTAAAVQSPRGIAFSGSGDLYIAEYGDSRVRLVHDNRIQTFAGDGQCRTSDPESGDARATSLCNPAIVVIAPDGAVYIAQRNGAHWVARVDAAGKLSTLTIGFPVAGMVFDPGVGLVVADATRGALVVLSSGAPTRADTLVPALGMVRGLAVGPDGSLYVGRSRDSGGTWALLKLHPDP